MFYAEIFSCSLDYMDIYKLKCAAYFHDIGKLNIPAEILNKPSKLTDKEYKIIKNHPQIGCEYLNGIGIEDAISLMKNDKGAFDQKYLASLLTPLNMIL